MAAEITREDVLAALDRSDDFVLIDVRSEGAYQRGHLPGAISIPYASLDMGKLPVGVGSNTPIVVYCYIGVASAKVADLMSEAGFSSVKSMAGGHTAWRFLKGAPPDERTCA